ncbi:MAG TPA: aminotransferase class IV [Plasticicumulans sp.]|nr:aminotransferase class IV [Plasticicumulans sp.]
MPLAPVAVRWCAHPLSENPRLAGLKHLNRLDQVLARAEWDDPDLQEGLMCLPDGTPVEATAANLFLVRDGRLHTPRLDRAGIAGIVRGVLIGRARQLGLEVLEARVDRDELLAADELFLCNSVYGLRPVRALGERRWPAPGPLTQYLAEDFETLRRAEAA